MLHLHSSSLIHHAYRVKRMYVRMLEGILERLTACPQNRGDVSEKRTQSQAPTNE
jgi:hypothetical protein